MVKKVQAEHGVLVGGIVGAAVILLGSVLLCGFFALLVSSGRVGEGSQGKLTALAAFLASVVGALVAWRKNGGMALLSGAAAAGLAIGVRLMLSLLSGGNLGGDTLIVSGGMLLGAVLTGFLAAGKRKKRR